MTGIVILFLYILVIAASLWGAFKLKPVLLSKQKPKTRFSIVVAFKNEVEHLPVLLRSLQQLDYPQNLYEIIMVNDHSTDEYTNLFFQNSSVKLINNKATGKKSALQTGILHSRFDWIVTTDADCVVPVDWLRYFDQIVQANNIKMVLGPVRFNESNYFWSAFQQFEFLSLQTFTMAGIYWKKPFLANGASLCFNKEAYRQVNAYDGNLQLASGDDVFLLEKFQTRFTGQIGFAKNPQATVLTHSQSGWNDLIQQKIRWSSKTKYQKSLLPKIIGTIVLLTNLFLLWSYACFGQYIFYVSFAMVKFISDFVLWLYISRWFQVKLHGKYFVFSFFLYPFYFLYVFVKSLNGKYVWKGTNYKS